MGGIARALLLALAALALGSCGDRRLLLSVNLLSFFAPGDTDIFFGPIPPLPGGFYSGEQPLVDDQRISLFGGAGDVVEVRSVVISAAAVAIGETGTGSDTLRIYLSGPDQPPIPGTPILTGVVTFAAGETRTFESVVEGSAELADLFTGEQVRLSVTTALRGPDSGDPLSGELKFTRLDAAVVAVRKPF